MHPQDLTPANDTERLDGILSKDGPLAICTWDEHCGEWMPMVCAGGRARIDAVLAQHRARQIQQAQADHMEDVAEQRGRAANDLQTLGRVA